MLRAAYFGQELLSTFGTQIGEIALVPATGGLFTVELVRYPRFSEISNMANGAVKTYIPSNEAGEQGADAKKVLLWDRKAEGGFPGTCKLSQDRYINSLFAETKVLKQLVRDKIDPTRDLGHSDKHGKKKEEKAVPEKTDQKETQGTASEGTEIKRNPDGTICEDCR